MEKITFNNEEEKIDFYVIEQTVLSGTTYLLVTEEEDEEGDEAEAYILKELSSDGDEVTYEMVEDDVTLEALGKIFSELLDDTDVRA